MIALTSPRDGQATAFGVHRALDTTGAMLGPLIGFGILTLAPDAYDAVFVVSFCAALIGLGIIALFVQNPPAQGTSEGIAWDTPDDEPVSLRRAMSLTREPRLARLLLIGTLLSLATMSDGFIYLTLQRQLDLSVGFFPLLYVATALMFMVLAVPVGMVADRVGRGRTFLAGYLLLLGVYASLLIPLPGVAEVAIALLLLGVYYAATDGVLMALASPVIPDDQKTSGFALLTTATSLSRLFSSILFGLLWTWQDVDVAILTFCGVLTVSLVITALVLRTPQLNWEGRTDGDG
jgi:MFS family permease